MALVDLSEKLVDVLQHIDIVFWAPTVADVKYKDLEQMPDGYIDLAFIDGMVRMSEQEHMTKVMRRKAKTLIAFGACASLGGIAGLGNLHQRMELLQTGYIDTPSTDNPEGILPQPKCLEEGRYDLTLPLFYDKVRPITQIVDVDYLVGGCPPHHDFVAQAVQMILQGNLPPAGSWLTSGKAVCDSCTRNPANENLLRKPLTDIKRTIEGVEETGCLLQHGQLCLGPVTQGDCNGACPKVSMPCRGCGGPLPGIDDFGAQAISAIGAILKDEDAVQRMLNQYPNLAKMVYRYALPASYLGSKL